MPATLKDIAERARVTSATVSMVINNKPNISPETREKVMAIARELNYYPNAIARGLAMQRANAIGVIVPNLASSYVVRILQGIKSTNKDSTYTVQLFDTIGQKEKDIQLFQRLSRERRIDGAILIDSASSEEEVRAFKNEQVPCVIVARRCEGIDSVFVNNTHGSEEATNYLVSKGHHLIACVICNKKNLPMHDRLAGYKKSLKNHAIPLNRNLIFEVKDDSMSEGETLFSQIINSDPRPTAVFVPAGDMVAIGLIKMAKRSGITIPNEFSVVGYDDLPAAEVIEPELTTIRQPKLEMGDSAINLIVDKIEGKETLIRYIELPTKLILRNSA
ncbi:MAG: LacI family DNA-binding transcriptional regulator [Chitinivibrionales bacterium]|nr:LacI family DNA-binding transcriptional regulator [Chitinivibrionales bacterium]